MRDITKQQAVRKERVAEVTERPIQPDMTVLPQALIDHFEAQGFRVTMASRMPEEVGKLSGYARHPIALSDLPEALRENNGLTLRKSGIWTDPSGLLYKGDCYIYQQAYDAYEAQMAEGRELWLQQDRDSVDAEKAAELSAELARAAGDRNFNQYSRVEVYSTSKLSDFVGRVG